MTPSALYHLTTTTSSITFGRWRPGSLESANHGVHNTPGRPLGSRSRVAITTSSWPSSYARRWLSNMKAAATLTKLGWGGRSKHIKSTSVNSWKASTLWTICVTLTSLPTSLFWMLRLDSWLRLWQMIAYDPAFSLRQTNLCWRPTRLKTQHSCLSTLNGLSKTCGSSEIRPLQGLVVIVTTEASSWLPMRQNSGSSSF